MSEIDWCFRKSVVQNLPDETLMWLSKSFTNFTGTAHQLHRQNIVSSPACRMCNVEIENDTLHVLSCVHSLFTQHRNEKASTLQIQTLGLLEEDMLPLCLLEWMLDPTYELIEEVPVRVMSSLQQVSKRNVWFGFLPAMFLKWVR